MPYPPAFLFVALLVSSSAAFGEGDVNSTVKARLELEAQLSDMVRIPPPQVEIVYDALEANDMDLAEASIFLDGKPLQSALTTLQSPGSHTLYVGPITPGAHTLEARALYADTSPILFSALSGYKWKVGTRFGFQAQNGLAVTVHVSPKLDAHAATPKTRLKLRGDVSARMIAALDDGTMPPEPAKPMLAVAEEETVATAPDAPPSAPEAPAPKPAVKKATPTRQPAVAVKPKAKAKVVPAVAKGSPGMALAKAVVPLTAPETLQSDVAALPPAPPPVVAPPMPAAAPVVATVHPTRSLASSSAPAVLLVIAACLLGVVALLGSRRRR